jgi:hypothetical protein
MSLMSRTWFVRCLSTNILDAPATVFLHVYTRTAKTNPESANAVRKHIMNDESDTSRELLYI